MNTILKIGLVILIWFFFSTKTNAQIFGYDGRSELPTIKINKGVIYKKGRAVGKIKSNLLYEYSEDGFVNVLVIKDNKVYYINNDEDVDVVEEFGYIFYNNIIYLSPDTTDVLYSIKDEFVYKGDKKKLVKIEGNYKFIELIAVLYFLEKI